MTKKEFHLLYTIKKNGLQDYQELSILTKESAAFISETIKEFAGKGYLDGNQISKKGLNALAPYKVDNAIIMAAGMSSRFVPLSLEKPKGLLTVNNEVLIERQIEQLQEAGVKDIILVLGYKKEAFFYLEDKYEGIKILINPEYNTKNNPHTLYLAQKYLKNTYICSSDDYFEENPFEEYVYQSYYAAIEVHEKMNEWYMIPDSQMNISGISLSGREGYIMLGHVYWDNAFSKEMVRLLNEDHEVGAYAQQLWEHILSDHLKQLPPMEIRVYPSDMIHEFDSLDELRQYDLNYVTNTHSKIMRNIAGVLGCEEQDITHFKAIKEGITNTSFVFEVKGEKYVYRHPGEETERIISRAHEKRAEEMAKSIAADPTYIYMDDAEGWKLSHYAEGIRVPDYTVEEDSLQVLKGMRRLHERNLSVDWEFLPLEEARKIEEILLREKGGIADPEFNRIKENVLKCYQKLSGDGIQKRFCHCSAYAQNWMLTEQGDAVLIDWEFAGNADPGCDLGSYIMDSMWQIDEAESFIKAYCGKEYDDTCRIHYLAYTAIMSFFWYVWALYREACGVVLGDSLYNRRVMAKRYSDHLIF